MDLTAQSLRSGALRADGAGTAVDRVYDDLRERIVGFDLPPGTTLSRNDLAREYNVSQTPLREALQRLEQDGLIRIFPQSKTVVAPIDEDQLDETHFLRVAVESEVVRRLAVMENAEAMRRARGFVRMQEALMDDTSQMRLFDDIDRSFHLTLFEAVGKAPLYAMLLRRLGHLARCQRLELPRKGKMSEIVHGHMAIIEAISAGDPEASAAALRGHIGGTIRRIASLRDDYPEYFSGRRHDNPE